MKKVVINASGGGSDAGASGNGIIEKDITLEISNIIKNKLESNGVEVLMLRDKDETISYDDRIKKLKMTYPNPYEVVLLSNTLNTTPGIDIIYPLKKTDTLAGAISNNLDYFNDTKYYQYRWPSDTTKDYYYLTRNTPDYETIIVRYGLPTNATDAKILKEDYKEMALSVADAILEYIGVSNYDGNSYTVVSGDSLYSIAKKFDTTVDKLKELNNLTSNNLAIGKVLKIPQAEIKDDNSVTNGTNTYTIKSGDTLYGIATKFNTTVDKLKELNNLTSNTLTIGKVLIIPSDDNNSSISNPNTYIVKSGDTLYSIAKKFNISVDNLKLMNNKTSNMISIGEELKVNNMIPYTIKSGDTLYSIAKEYNTTVDKIKDINNLKNDNLTIGNILYIP